MAVAASTGAIVVIAAAAAARRRRMEECSKNYDAEKCDYDCIQYRTLSRERISTTREYETIRAHNTCINVPDRVYTEENVRDAFVGLIVLGIFAIVVLVAVLTEDGY